MILQPDAYFAEASAHLWQMHCFCLPALPPALHALSHLPSRLASKFPNRRRKRGGDGGERVCFILKGSCTSCESGVTAIGISLLEESPELRAPLEEGWPKAVGRHSSLEPRGLMGVEWEGLTDTTLSALFSDS